MTSSWKKSAGQTLRRLQASNPEPARAALMGIGHALRGDDAAGLEVACRLKPAANERFLVVEAGHAPENATGPVRRFAPALVLLVDAAQMGMPAGTVRWLDWRTTTGLSGSTHTLPPYVLARYLTLALGCEVALLGIQPAQTDLGAGLSDVVETAVTDVTATLFNLFSL